MFVVYIFYLLIQKIRKRLGSCEIPQKEVEGIPDEPIESVVEKRLGNGGN